VTYSAVTGEFTVAASGAYECTFGVSATAATALVSLTNSSGTVYPGSSIAPTSCDLIVYTIVLSLNSGNTVRINSPSPLTLCSSIASSQTVFLTITKII
jgi:hypothetical protein